MNVTLTKHHGLGNDFLVCDRAQPLPAPPAWDALARRWCDRRRGIGADGLLLLDVIGPAEVAMVLHNADGSRAEMSGNGIRCLAQAALRVLGIDGPTELVVHTDAGDRSVAVVPVDDLTIEASVDMGEVGDLAAPAGWDEVGADPARPVMHLTLGNPHTVVGVEDVAIVDLLSIGGQVPQVNLEIVEPGLQHHEVRMRVHERGAGITEACGTGACAAAWAAASWGLAAPKEGEIIVHMDGGDARVRLHEPSSGRVTLVGPATFVGTVTVPV